MRDNRANTKRASEDAHSEVGAGVTTLLYRVRILRCGTITPMSDARLRMRTLWD